MSFPSSADPAAAPVALPEPELPRGGVFPAFSPFAVPAFAGKRIGLVASGGSGATSALCGVRRAFEEAGLEVVALSACSGSMLFASLWAAGLDAETMAHFWLDLSTRDYLDPNCSHVLRAPLRRFRGFGGLLQGEALEQTYLRRFGALKLGQTRVPLSVVLWNVDRNELSYVGTKTTPELVLARAVRAVCHIDHRRAFFSGVHAERGIRCADCHGGNPATLTRAQAHSGRFLGRPAKRQIAALCSSCHADPNQMRQFGLAVRRDGGAPHEPARSAARARRPERPHLHRLPRGASHPAGHRRPQQHEPAQHPRPCATCHRDPERMKPYGIPTTQFEEYSASAHGIALFERRNFAAPTCVGCHGSHSALPPGVTQVADVCGRCHELVRSAFSRGPHACAAARGALGCLSCSRRQG